MASLSLDTILMFGKHRGKQLEDVVEDDPAYVRWLAENEIKELDGEVLEALEKREQRKH